MELTDNTVCRFKFKCRYCNIFKTKGCFSKKEIGPLERDVARNPGMRLDPISPLLRCMECKGGQVMERQCEGPCSKIKTLDMFSKSQRSRGNGVNMQNFHEQDVLYMCATADVLFIVVHGMCSMEGRSSSRGQYYTCSWYRARAA